VNKELGRMWNEEVESYFNVQSVCFYMNGLESVTESPVIVDGIRTEN
jgi:hypothetical protein